MFDRRFYVWTYNTAPYPPLSSINLANCAFTFLVLGRRFCKATYNALIMFIGIETN